MATAVPAAEAPFEMVGSSEDDATETVVVIVSALSNGLNVLLHTLEDLLRILRVEGVKGRRREAAPTRRPPDAVVGAGGTMSRLRE